MSSIKYQSLYNAATQAAEKAADEWMQAALKRGPLWKVIQHSNPLDDNSPGKVVGELLDVCGFGYVEITDKRTGFAKFIKQKQNGYNGAVHFRHKYSGRQEMGLNVAAATAAFVVLTKGGVKGIRVYQNID